jgi:hypothetical protein
LGYGPKESGRAGMLHFLDIIRILCYCILNDGINTSRMVSESRLPAWGRDREKLRKGADKQLKILTSVNVCAFSRRGDSAGTARTLENLLHRAGDLTDALFDQRRRLADVSDGLTAIVEDAKVP